MKTIMRSRILGLTALVVTAIALLGSCNNKEEQPTQPTETATANTPEAVKTVEYTVVVNGDANTKATVDADMKTLRFAAGDKLYITADDRADLRGFLTLKDGDEGKTQGATFTGTLEYTGDAPASDLSVKATLVGSTNQGFTLSGDGKAIEGDIAYPSASFCSDVNDAVEKYSNLTGTSTYGTGSFQLTQETAFLNFSLTIKDGTASGVDISVTVANNGADIASATVTTATVSSDVMANFVLPVAATTTLDGATVTVGSHPAISFGGASAKSLTGKVYNVARWAPAPALGNLFYSDGCYSSTGIDGKTPIGVIAYLGTDAFSENGVTLRDGTTRLQSHGLVLCLKNAASHVVWGPDNLNLYEFGAEAAVSDVNGLKRTENVSGYINTKTIAEKADAATNYPALYQAWNYSTLPAPASTTGWFMPSAQQWVRMQTGLGEMNLSELDYMQKGYGKTAAAKWDAALAKAGSGNYDVMNNGGNNWSSNWKYWSSTEYYDSRYSDGKYVVIQSVYNNGFWMTATVKTSTYASTSEGRVRPVLAF